MSFFATFQFKDRIELLTDGAVYVSTGELVATMTKVRRSQQIPFAITGRGNSRMVSGLMDLCITIADVADTAGSAVGLIDDAIEEWTRKNGDYHGLPFELCMVCHDPVHGFGQFQIHGFDPAHAERMQCVPMKLYTSWGPLYAGGELDMERVRQVLTLETVQLGAASFGPAFCQLAREAKGIGFNQSPDDEPHHGCGGHIDLTTVTAHGVKTERLLNWSDKKYKKIDGSLLPSEVFLLDLAEPSPLIVEPPAWVVRQEQNAAA